MAEIKSHWGLLRRRELLVPTWRGWLAVLMIMLLGVLAVGQSIHPFLAASQSVPSRWLVVEGWAPDYALEAAAVEFKSRGYERLFVTGGPLEQGGPS